MASVEATPNQSLPEENHVGRTHHTIVFEGETIEFPDPGNFPGVLEAYFHNKNGESSNDYYLRANQSYLEGSHIGQAVTGALDKVCADEKNHSLLALTFVPSTETERAYYHSKIIDIAVPHLPQVWDAAVLRDPWAFEDAA